MKRIMMRGTLLLCGVLLSGGCRKDLCYDHDRHAPRVQVALQPAWAVPYTALTLPTNPRG